MGERESVCLKMVSHVRFSQPFDRKGGYLSIRIM